MNKSAGGLVTLSLSLERILTSLLESARQTARIVLLAELKTDRSRAAQDVEKIFQLADLNKWKVGVNPPHAQPSCESDWSGVKKTR